MSESVDRVTEIAGRVAAATEGPWPITENSHFVSRGTEIPDFRVEGPEADLEGESARADAEFIAHAREDIPYLLERLRTAEAEVAARDAVIAQASTMLWRHGLRGGWEAAGQEAKRILSNYRAGAKRE